jgi:hypothetical protein
LIRYHEFEEATSRSAAEALPLANQPTETHETPPGSPLRETGFEVSADARGKLKVTGLVTCVEDARHLTNLCAVRGIDKLMIRYADYVSLSCVDALKHHITAARLLP